MIISSLKGNNKKTIRIIIGAAIFIMACFVVQYFYFRPPSFEEAMRQAASDPGKNYPILVSQHMKLEKVVAMPGNVFSYDYTLIHLEQSQINADTLRKYIEPCIIHEVKTNPDMKNFRENKTTITYSYADKKGVLILKLLVTPDKYSDN